MDQKVLTLPNGGRALTHYLPRDPYSKYININQMKQTEYVGSMYINPKKILTHE